MECSNLHLITYLNEVEILDILTEKQAQIKRAVYIKHDKDENEIHYHIVLQLVRSRDIDVVRRWFYIDERNTLAKKNTFSNASVIDYFLHRNKASVDDGKHSYNEEDLLFFNCSLDDFVKKLDNSFEILQLLLSGTSYFEIARLYGKDFIYHISQYKQLVELISVERHRQFENDICLSGDFTKVDNWGDLPFKHN